MVDPAGKKLLSQAMAGNARAFRVRYMTLCAGAIVGPAIGGVLYSVSPAAFFAVPAFFYGAYMVLIAARRRRLSALETPAEKRRPGHRFADGGPTRPAADRDHRRRIRHIRGVFAAGIDDPALHEGPYGSHAQSYFAVLFITNAVLALAFQLPIDRASAKLSRNVLIALGCAAFALSFVCFWVSSVSVLLLFAGIAIWTVGEGILLPMPDMAVHEMAEDNRKGVYFGLSDFRQLGFFCGPLLGGFLLGTSVAAYFAVMGALIFLAAPLLFRSSPVRVPTPEKVLADC